LKGESAAKFKDHRTWTAGAIISMDGDMTRNRRSSGLAVCGAAVLAVSAARAWAQDPDELGSKPKPPFVRVSASESVDAAPDQAEIDVGVVTQAKTAAKAASENAKRVDEVLSKIRSAGGKEAEIRTAGYTINPDYRSGEGQAPEITGYTASNVVHVKIRRLDRVSGIIDAATGGGANTVQSLRFTLKDEGPVRADALRGAARKARAEAEAAASALDQKIGRVLSIDVGSAEIVFPERGMLMAARAAPPTPIEPGTIQVQARVTVTFEIVR
jgi:hypothetical protein